MKIAVLGASGRTGRLVIDQGIDRGHTMVALVRDAARLPARDGLTVITGDPMSTSDVERVTSGADSVIVTLNNARASDLPWAAPVSPRDILEAAARNVAAAVKNAPATRIVILSALGVGDSFANTPWILRKLIQHTNLGVAYADHNRVDAFIRSTALDWTLVRPVGLSNSEKTGHLIVGTASNPKPAMMIARKTVAGFLLSCAESGDYSRMAPVISEK